MNWNVPQLAGFIPEEGKVTAVTLTIEKALKRIQKLRGQKVQVRYWASRGEGIVEKPTNHKCFFVGWLGFLFV